jgi:hypothetical protein
MKMTMKRLIIVSVSLLMFLTGCAQMNGNTANASASASPVIDRILQRGALVVGMAGNMPPLNCRTAAGLAVGQN